MHPRARPLPLSILLPCALLTGCTTSGTIDPRPDGGGANCVEGEQVCDGERLLRCVDGDLELDSVCSLACDAALGCVTCHPGQARCDGDTSQVCESDGRGHVDTACDTRAGQVCHSVTGRCVIPCESLGPSYVGCQFFPTVTANGVGGRFDEQFGLVISNTWDSAATVTIEGGGLAGPYVVQVPAGGLSVERLPMQAELRACASHSTCRECSTPQVDNHRVWSGRVEQGAYHLTSNRPITLYQFNPLPYELLEGPGDSATLSYSNDASLLFPVNGLSTHYIAASWWSSGDSPTPMRADDQTFCVGFSSERILPPEGFLSGRPSMLAITATVDATDVTVTTTARVFGSHGAPNFEPGDPQSVALNQGDVLQLLAFDGDLTGTDIHATQPVQVLGGHYCANIPAGVGACDHIEESIPPVDRLGRRYAVTTPTLAGPLEGPARTSVVRIIATEDDTSLAFDPPVPALNHIGRTGEFVEIIGQDGFIVDSDRPVLVAQYLVGSSYGVGPHPPPPEEIRLRGDPAMTIVAPVEQYRDRYLFHAPENYPHNFVNIVGPADAEVLLDGESIPLSSPLGRGDFAFARVPLGVGATAGDHVVRSNLPVGISVYGYGSFTSYWYPGGLDLDPLF